jgi:hypothetical protein
MSDIAKLAVFDARIVQSQQKYAVQKGALSITNAPYNAIAASASQFTFNINVPSQNVFVDRAIEWSSTVYQQLTVSTGANPSTWAVGVANAGWANPVAIYTPGIDFSLCSFPLHQMCGTMTATINDTSVVMNLDTVLREVIRLTDYKKNRLVRTCPTMLDKHAFYLTGAGAVNNVVSGFQNATEPAEVPNGAWFDLQFTDATGVALSGGTFASPLVYQQANGYYVVHYGGLPYRTPVPAAGYAGLNAAGGITVAGIPGLGAVQDLVGGGANLYNLYVQWRTTEKLILSPFIFADSHEWSTGLMGVNNIQLVMNLSTDGAARCFRDASLASSISAVQFFNPAGSGSPFTGAVVNVQFLTPSLDLPLPPKSAVPFAEYPRYISAQYPVINAGVLGTQLQSQTITLPQIPDALIIYCKPTAASAGASVGLGGFSDFYLPISRINVNFDNFSGLLSSHTTEQLYGMSTHNGLEMDFPSWRGRGRIGTGSGSSVQALVGGYLVLRMAQDITCQSGQSPGLVGNFTLQFTVTVDNTTTVPLQPVLYVIAVNTGFFETLAGSSRVVKGVLSEADIIAAEPIPEMTQDGLARVVGAGFFDKIGSFISKARDIYTATKPAVSAVKKMLPEGKIKKGLEMVGYGMEEKGMGLAGAGRAGAGRKMNLSSRLM